ncbi:MAG: hypothetical protein R2754_16385 [Microthrixaceae bacterium]
MADLAADGAWFHVDAAGGAAINSDSYGQCSPASSVPTRSPLTP